MSNAGRKPLGEANKKSLHITVDDGVDAWLRSKKQDLGTPISSIVNKIMLKEINRRGDKTIKTGGELFRFDSFNGWLNTAKPFFGEIHLQRHQYIAIDSAGRICLSGSEFERARDEGTFPIIVYRSLT